MAEGLEISSLFSSSLPPGQPEGGRETGGEGSGEGGCCQVLLSPRLEASEILPGSLVTALVTDLLLVPRQFALALC